MTEPRVIPIVPGVWTLHGLSRANAHVLETPAGVVVVDTGNDLAEGRAIHQLLRTVTGQDVVGVIYTHSHYVHGTAALAGNDVPILAHHNFHVGDPLAPLFEQRHQAQYGMDAPRGPSGHVPPNHFVTGNGAELDFAGLRLVGYTEYPFDTPDCLILWWPAKRIAIHNHLTGNFPNVYSIGGGRFRDPAPWIAGLNVMLDLQPDHLLGCHGLPVSGRDEVRERLTVNRDALQFLLDETIRGLNAGLTPDELVGTIQLPARLAEHPALQQTYGEVAHHIRAIATGLVGWFDGDPANLHTVAPQFESAQIVTGFGGVEPTLVKVREAMVAGHWPWAAKLSRHVLRTVPGNVDAKRLLAESLRQLAERTTAWGTRNYCLTHARRLER